MKRNDDPLERVSRRFGDAGVIVAAVLASLTAISGLVGYMLLWVYAPVLALLLPPILLVALVREAKKGREDKE